MSACISVSMWLYVVGYFTEASEANLTDATFKRYGVQDVIKG